jgi:small conductance mechanosensitive channel
VGVSYDADLDAVRQIVDQVGVQIFADEDWKDILDEAPTYVGVTELADSSVTVRVVARVRPGNQGGISRELNYRLKLAFDAAGIDIPYPQRVLHNAKA